MKNKTSYFIFTMLIYIWQYDNCIYAQQINIDSLQKVLLISKEDTGKVTILNNLAKEFRKTNPDTSIYYAKVAITLSKKLNYTSVLPEVYLWWGTSLTQLGKYEEALKQYTIATTLSEQLIQRSQTGNKKNKSILARIYNNTSTVYAQKGDYTEALKYNYKSLKIRKEIDDQTGIAVSYNNIGVDYADRGNYPEALKYYFLALRLHEKAKDKKQSGNCYSNIGEIYYYQGNFGDAIKNYLIALNLSKENREIILEGNCYNKLSAIYIEQKKYSDALTSSQKALQIFKKNGNKEGIGYSKMAIGNIKKYQKLYSDALKIYLEADTIFEETGGKLGIITAKINIAEIYNKLCDYKNALDYGKKGLLLSKENEVISSQRDAYLELYEIYKKTNKHREALEMHESYIQLRDSVINEKNQKDILSQQFKYDYDKKALSDSLNFASQKNISDLKNEAEHKIEQNKRYALYAGLFLALIFSLFIFNRFKITAKQKKVIEYQNSQIVESINYSKHIQASLLPSINVMQKALNNLFILYEPKAIVSGDFYWFKDFEKYTILACVDCTGHGVPGGFMSTLGFLLLDKVVNADQLNPSDILSNLSDEIISVLHQQAGGAIQDGMDLSICLIDKEHHTVEFAGARNGIIVVTNGVAKKYKADLFPVGGSYLKKGREFERVFKTQKIDLEKNDWIYMYTDGFVEQNGGEQNLPMSYSQFENQLIAISNQLSSEEKIQKLKQELDAWRGTNERDDDVLVMGFQIS